VVPSFGDEEVAPTEQIILILASSSQRTCSYKASFDVTHHA
jgi:hypothetical protein